MLFTTFRAEEDVQIPVVLAVAVMVLFMMLTEGRLPPFLNREMRRLVNQGQWQI
jgi:hypothetical protein